MCKTEKETQMYRTDFWTLWEKVRVGWSERIALKHVYYQVWNRSPAQAGCMRQVLRAGALGWPRGMGWGGRWEGGSGWGTHVNPWLIHVSVWQKPLKYWNIISHQLIKINGKKREDKILDKKKKDVAILQYKIQIWMSCIRIKLKVLVSHVWFCVTAWTVTCQALLSTEFSRQEYWSGLPFPSPGDLPDPGIEPGSPALQADTLLSEPLGKSIRIKVYNKVMNFNSLSRWNLFPNVK